jgi:hypothetical protein
MTTATPRPVIAKQDTFGGAAERSEAEGEDA